MNICKLFVSSIFFILFVAKTYAQPCFSDKVVTSAFATSGSSVNKTKVLWLTWGSTNQTTNPYGRHNIQLLKGTKSYASIPLGGDKYLCIEAEIINIASGAVNSYAPGNYSGDSFDDLYNIGGSGSNNRLVTGIRNRINAETSTLTIKCKATIDGVPIRLPGMVVADAESLASNEYIYATADGKWNLVELKKNTADSAYNVSKESVAGSTMQTIKFLAGNDNNTAAIAFLAFNETAYNTTGNSPDLSVQFSATLKGGGLTALALGLLTPSADLGDAPKSYGAPINLLQNISFTLDNIPTGTVTNVNTNNYKPGSLVNVAGSFLGSVAPDSDNRIQASKDALGDDRIGVANEEDAWPDELKRFSVKSNYIAGAKITAKIPYKNGLVNDKISGWIDFNLNGAFDEEERATVKIGKDGDGSVNLIWTVPDFRIAYNTFVRLRYFHSAEDATSAISNVNFGEVEDHKIYILGPAITNPMLPSKHKFENKQK